MAEVTPPPIQGPSSKERKYDRQLRLWAANGQAALERSHVLLINSGPGVVGVEALKNLVLPGTGSFTVLDPASVAEQDLGINFFLEDEDLGKSRAERCSHWLQELNPDVQGHHIKQSAQAFLTSKDALSPYTLILALLPLDGETLKNLSQWTQDLAIPVFYIHSIGFYSHFTVQLPPAFPIIDTHPDPSTTTDLRLLEPWPELLKHLEEKTANMENMDDEQHGHIPYVLILLKFLEEWKLDHDGKPPESYKEMSAFRAMVKKKARTENAEGGEENFDEAASAVLRILNPAVPSSAVKEVLEAEECLMLDKNSDNFWVIAHAIQDFWKQHGVLPVSGGLPDMKAKSADYVELQNIYKSKARRDVSKIMARVVELETELKRTPSIDQAEVEAFCKSAGYIKLVRGRAPHLAQPASAMKWKDRAAFAANALKDENSLIPIYIALLAYDSVLTITEGRGAAFSQNAESHQIDADETAAVANSMIHRLLGEAGVALDDEQLSDVEENVSDIVTELIRANGGELHNISALTGGMIAQEAIKVITKQYIPVDNTCIFDGVLSKTSVVRL